MVRTPAAKRATSSGVVVKLVIQRTSDSVRSHSQKNDHACSGSMAAAGTVANTVEAPQAAVPLRIAAGVVLAYGVYAPLAR